MFRQIKHVEIDGNNIVRAISYLNKDESVKGLIVVSDEINVGEDYIYNPTTQTFTPPKPQPVPEVQPSIEEKILAENQYQTMLLELTSVGGM